MNVSINISSTTAFNLLKEIERAEFYFNDGEYTVERAKEILAAMRECTNKINKELSYTWMGENTSEPEEF